MQISKAKLSKDIEKQTYNIFNQTIADLNTHREAEVFMHDFLTKMERTTLAKRLMIAYYLEQRKSYDFIKKTIKVSSATIANVDKMMTKYSKGFILALKKIETDQWAANLAKKTTNIFKNLTGIK